MTASSSESEEEFGYFYSQFNKLVGLFTENTDKKVTLEDLKPLLDEVFTFLESTSDYCTEEVEHALSILCLVPECLVHDRHSHFNNTFPNCDTDQILTRQHEVGQYIIQQGYPSITVKALRSLQDKLSSTHISDHILDQCETNIKVLFVMFHVYTGTYPKHAAPFCRSICKEAVPETLAQSLLYFDDSDRNIPHKTDRILETKKEILATLHNVILECPDYRDTYRRANVVNALSKMQTTDEEIKMLSLLILAYIVDETENDLIVKSQDSVQLLTKLFVESAFSAKHMADSSNFGEDKTQVYTCRELLSGLNHLAVHDANKEAIVEHGGIPAIIRMLQSDFSEDERQLAAEALSNLALKGDIRKNVEIQKAKSSKEEIIFLHSITRILVNWK